MGVGVQAAHSLVQACIDGVSFESTVTIGRQELVDPAAALRAVAALKGSIEGAPALGDGAWRYADPLFRLLGAQQVDALDASTFEGAAVIQDLNEPIPDSLAERYDVVFDGGSLEHVFNFPVALTSCMRMAKVGGRVIIHGAGDNWLGHGFYQFSPELFFRVFCADNGFEVEQLLLWEAIKHGRCWSMRDPADVKMRAETRTRHPVLLWAQARKVESVPKLFAKWPQQSDYAGAWTAFRNEGDARLPRTCRRRTTLLERLVAWNAWLSYRVQVRKDLKRAKRRSPERQTDFYRPTDSRGRPNAL